MTKGEDGLRVKLMDLLKEFRGINKDRSIILGVLQEAAESLLVKIQGPVRDQGGYPPMMDSINPD